MSNSDDILLQVNDLKVDFLTFAGRVHAVRGVSFDVRRGETLAIVGESGCGKSVTSKAIMRLLQPKIAEVSQDSSILFEGEDVLKFDKKRLASYRGGDVSIVFQDAMASLNPTMTVGRQIIENLSHHTSLSKKEMKERAIELLRRVGLSEPEKRFKQYPHELSGGMRQRVMIAIAFANKPKLLIADEPTTALDVTIQSQVMDLIKELQRENNTAVILITHDLGVVANIADRIAVMYAGTIVERGLSKEIFYKQKHPYANALLAAVPRLDMDGTKELFSIEGTPPDLLNPPLGCPFKNRCKFCMEICDRENPPAHDFSEQHQAACWLYNLQEIPTDVDFATLDEEEESYFKRVTDNE